MGLKILSLPQRQEARGRSRKELSLVKVDLSHAGSCKNLRLFMSYYYLLVFHPYQHKIEYEVVGDIHRIIQD